MKAVNIKSNRKAPKNAAYPIAVHNLHQEVEPAKKKFKKHKKRNPFDQFYKEKPKNFPIRTYDRLLDGYILLGACQVELPHEAIRCKLNGEFLGDVAEEDMRFFTNLSTLDLSDNNLNLEHLDCLPNVVDLNLMCNKIVGIPQLTSGFQRLEVLNLSYNRIPASHISNLAAIPKLSVLDLSSNDLATLPDDMSKFKTLRELSLASNAFSTDSVVYSASMLFQTLSTIPYLKKLVLARNKLRGIHNEKLEENVFLHLSELDFSYNWVDSEQGLIPATQFTSLQVLIITGNPLALANEYSNLEKSLQESSACAIVNEPGSPLYYLRYPKRKDKVPQPKPMYTLAEDESTVAKNQLFGVELSKEMGSLAISDLQSADHKEKEDLWPKEIEYMPTYKDIYTPTDRGDSRPAMSGMGAERGKEGNAFFITEAEAQDAPEGWQHIPEGSESQYSEYADHQEYELKPITRLDEFRALAKDLLGDNKEYEHPIDLQGAYKQLKHALQHPRTYQGKSQGPHYTRSTANRESYAMQVRFREKSSKQMKLPSIQQIAAALEDINMDLSPRRLELASY